MTSIDFIAAISVAYVTAALLRYGLPRAPARWKLLPIAPDTATGAGIMILVSVGLAELAIILLHSLYRKGSSDPFEPAEAQVGALLWLFFAIPFGFLGVGRYPSAHLRPGLFGTLALVALPLAMIVLCTWLLDLPI